MKKWLVSLCLLLILVLSVTACGNPKGFDISVEQYLQNIKTMTTGVNSNFPVVRIVRADEQVSILFSLNELLGIFIKPAEGENITSIQLICDKSAIETLGKQDLDRSFALMLSALMPKNKMQKAELATKKCLEDFSPTKDFQKTIVLDEYDGIIVDINYLVAQKTFMAELLTEEK